MLETMRALPSPVVVPVVAGVDFPCSPAMVAMNTHVSQFFYSFLCGYASVVYELVEAVSERINTMIIFVRHIGEKFAVSGRLILVAAKFLVCVWSPGGIYNYCPVLQPADTIEHGTLVFMARSSV